MAGMEREHFSLRGTLGKSIIVGTFVGTGLAIMAAIVDRPDLAAWAALLGYGLGGAGYVGKEVWRKFRPAGNRPFLEKLHSNLPK